MPLLPDSFTARPSHYDPLSWAAGVLDAIGRFIVRVNDKDQRASCTIEAAVSIEMARELVAALDAGMIRNRAERQVVWFLPAHQQKTTLPTIIARLQINKDAAMACWQFRVSQEQRGRRVSGAVRRYRQVLRTRP